MDKLIVDFFNIIQLDTFGIFTVLLINLFSLLIALYSIGFLPQNFDRKKYYFYFVLTVLAANLTAVADNLIFFLVVWGFLGFTFYGMINTQPEGNSAAKKTFIILGASDALLILGVLLLPANTTIVTGHPIVMDRTLLYISFWCLAVAALAKAGAFPVHTWVPEVAEHGPLPVAAFMPAALDKILGIYLLVRLTQNIFVVDSITRLFLLLFGAITIIAAVMMALIQHNFKKLLGYHAVSQVGYMILGIASGSVIGLVGGVMHMLNNAIYKTSLFLTAGNVEKNCQTTELNELGGLAKKMPLTFISFLLSALAISGMPPLNGFVSKWLIYQGLLTGFRNGSALVQFILALFILAAMFGSALTLASFMKLAQAAFFGPGQWPKDKKFSKNFFREFPPLILAILCVAIGLGYQQLLIGIFQPIFPSFNLSSLWQPAIAWLLILFGLLLGIIFYAGYKKEPGKIGGRRSPVFVGGEIPDESERVTGQDFYLTVKELPLIRSFYQLAEKKLFDIYEIKVALTLTLGKILSWLHSGLLHTYVAWCILGTILLLFLLR